MLVVVALSTTACTIPISRIINRELIKGEQSNKDVNHNGATARIAVFLLVPLVLYLFYFSPKILLDYMPKSIGGIVANPGTTIETNENDYACVFSNDIKEKKSITFGVIAESKPESVHIFTPEYNQERNSYGEESENGKVIPNKLVESQVKIPGGYRIEKFDGSKHGYNHQTGKCEYVQTRYSHKEIFYKEYIENSKKPPHK